MRVPRHSDYRERKAAELRGAIEDWKAGGPAVVIVTMAEIAAEPGAPLNPSYWLAKRAREAGRDRG